MSIGPATPIRDRPHKVMLQNPGPRVPNDDGGFTQTWTDLVPPSLQVEIASAATADLERIAAGALVATATHIISGPFHPQVTTKTRVLFNGRVFAVKGVADPDQRGVSMALVCVEVVA